METGLLITALSLFAGLSLMPAVFLILREKEIRLDPRRSIRGGRAIALAFLLLGLATLCLGGGNAVALAVRKN